MSEPTKHAGDCTIFSSVINGRQWDGICTCGFGFKTLHTANGTADEIISEERKACNYVPIEDVKPLLDGIEEDGGGFATRAMDNFLAKHSDKLKSL